ncbi:MAG: class I SAM-dependent methyltransferase [Terriglobia bacterium]
MSQSALFYQAIFQSRLDSEAEWLRQGAKAKADAIQALAAHLPHPLESLCEMGCGTGAVLEECIRRGLAKEYIGADASKEALDWVRRRNPGKINLIHHDLESGAPELGLLPSIVVLSHILEHLRNPEVLLASLCGKCNYLIAEVPLENQIFPNSRAWVRSKIFRKARTDNPSGHVQFFSRSSFRKLMASSGWKILAQRIYIPYQNIALLFSARSGESVPWRSLFPYFVFKLFGRRVASRILCVHFAILAVPSDLASKC